MSAEGYEVVDVVDDDEVWLEIAHGIDDEVDDDVTVVLERAEAVETHHAEVIVGDVAVVLEFPHEVGD